MISQACVLRTAYGASLRKDHGPVNRSNVDPAISLGLLVSIDSKPKTCCRSTFKTCIHGHYFPSLGPRMYIQRPRQRKCVAVKSG